MSLANLLKDPALVVGLVRAVLIVATSFGVQITTDQQSSLLTLTGLALAIISLVLTGVTSSLTTSVASPSLPEGTTVDVITPVDEPNRTVTV